ncbi:restriction endonuclease subunit S [Celeribacter neptunius]|uniref:Type I restriction enzyme, S subunit n=1 Tax=Celeribacter neptunius TaxID=588602 RepID=A0A1I3TVG7_9RHOB|nr:restriction endonuclease subunit S [Celeribacter neptunius]SFJ74630.1 type I restriction enzyme, S subunit [Celeribacter neptunius]
MNSESVAIGEVCELFTGGTPDRKNDAFYEGGDVPWLVSGDIHNPEIKSCEGRITDAGLQSSAAKYLPEDSVLIALNGQGKTRGTVARLKMKATCNQSLVAIHPVDCKRLDSNFLFRNLQARYQEIRHLTGSQGNERRGLNMGLIKGIKIPLPPLEEQRRIAGILDQADALRRLRTRALDKLNTFGQAIFHEMFGDVRSEQASNALLGDCADFFSGNTLPEGEEFVDQKDGYLILKVSDLNRPGNAREVHEAALWSSVPGSKAATCPAGAIVFPKRGGAIGTNKKRTLMRPAILDPNLMGVLPRSNVINTDFLAGWFSLFTLSDIASGSSVPQLNKKDLSPLRLRVPEMTLQEQYGVQREKLQHVWQRANADLAAQEFLFASLQHRAFQGEL